MTELLRSLINKAALYLLYQIRVGCKLHLVLVSVFFFTVYKAPSKSIVYIKSFSYKMYGVHHYVAIKHSWLERRNQWSHEKQEITSGTSATHAWTLTFIVDMLLVKLGHNVYSFILYKPIQFVRNNEFYKITILRCADA